MKMKMVVLIGVAVLGLATVNLINAAPCSAPPSFAKATEGRVPEYLSDPPADMVGQAISDWPAGSISQSSGTTTSTGGTNSVPVPWYEQLGEGIGATVEAGVTNMAVEPFGIYALQHPAGESQVGGGLSVFYNLNNYVAPGAGIVYLGQLSVFSGSVTLRAPFQPLPASVPDLWITPNILAGIETAVGGAGTDNGTVGTLAGGGVSVSFGHLWGGQFNTGIEAVNRTAAGGYSGWAAQPFLGWSKSF